MPFEFKPLEIKQQGTWWQRLYKSKQVRKTVLYMAAGSLISLAISYFSESNGFAGMSNGEISNALITGAFFGFFITNNPCARGKC